MTSGMPRRRSTSTSSRSTSGVHESKPNWTWNTSMSAVSTHSGRSITGGHQRCSGRAARVVGVGVAQPLDRVRAVRR